MARRFKPLLDRVLVSKPIVEKSIGGVLLPESASTKAQEGMVVAVGPGRRSLQSGEVMPVSVKEGDKVLLPEYGGQVLKLEDKEYQLFRDEEILGVLSN